MLVPWKVITSFPFCKVPQVTSIKEGEAVLHMLLSSDPYNPPAKLLTDMACPEKNPMDAWGENKPFRLHPRNSTWNLKIMVSKRTFLFQGLIFRFHVKFRGCKDPNMFQVGETVKTSRG